MKIIKLNLNKIKNRSLTGVAHARSCSVRVTQDGEKPSDRWFVIPWTKVMGDHRKAALQQHDHVQMRSPAVCLSVLPEISRSQTKLTSRPPSAPTRPRRPVRLG